MAARAGLVGLAISTSVVAAAAPGAFGGPEDDIDLGHPSSEFVRIGNSGDVFAYASYGNNYRTDGVTSAGDINNDGVDDVVVGAPGENGNEGAAYVIYGGTLDAIDISFGSLGTRGFRIAEASPSDPPHGSAGGDPKDTTGYSVAAAGDVNDDGIDDVVVGAPNDTFNGAGDAQQTKARNGSIWVIYGQDTPDLADVDLDALGTRGMHVWGGSSGMAAGLSVAGLGHFNQGAVDDFAIGAPGYYGVAGTSQQNGAAVVVYGEDTPDPADLEITLWQTPSSRVMVALGKSNGFGGGVGTGNMVAGLGNFDRDAGFHGELGIGAAGYSYNPGPPADLRNSAGAAYVVYGLNNPDPADFYLSEAEFGKPADGRAMVMIGDTNFGAFGYEMKGNVDLTGDGAIDLVVSAPSLSVPGRQYAGGTYVIYGMLATESGDLDTRVFTGYTIVGPYANAEPTSIAAGDVSGDGVDDVLIGMRDQDRRGRTNSGSVYLVEGQTSSTENVDLGAAQPARVTVIDGAVAGDRAGRWVGVDVDGHPLVAAGGGGWLYYVGLAPVGTPVDVTPPTTTIDSGGGASTDTTPTFTFHANEPATFECSIDAGVPSFAACSGPGDSHTPSAPLGVGPHTFRVRATDAALNVGTPATVGFTVTTVTVPDTTAPQTTITSKPAATVRLKHGKKKVKVTFGFIASETSTFVCTMDGAPVACGSPKTYKLPQGKHVFTVAATDRAGNRDGSPARFTVKVKKPKKR